MTNDLGKRKHIDDAVEDNSTTLIDEKLHHKAVAPKYKSQFASHWYAFLSVGECIGNLPVAIGGNKIVLPLVVGVVMILFIGGCGSLFLYDIKIPPEQHLSKEQGMSETESSNQVAHVHKSTQTSCVGHTL